MAVPACKGRDELPMDEDASTRTYLLVVDDVLVRSGGGRWLRPRRDDGALGGDDRVPVVAQDLDG